MSLDFAPLVTRRCLQRISQVDSITQVAKAVNNIDRMRLFHISKDWEYFVCDTVESRQKVESLCQKNGLANAMHAYYTLYDGNIIKQVQCLK